MKDDVTIKPDGGEDSRATRIARWVAWIVIIAAVIWVLATLGNSY